MFSLILNALLVIHRKGKLLLTGHSAGYFMPHHALKMRHFTHTKE